MIANLNKILVILGPTSSGKSDIAIKMAKKFNGEIISADSRQVYRGMDVGTGKVYGKWDSKNKALVSEGILHHMIDIASPRTDYSVAKFKKQSENIISDILKRGRLPIICGGTGFWIQAIVDNVNFPEVKPNWKLRKKMETNSTEKLFAMLKKMDPIRAKNIDSKNKIRLIRAIEICRAIKKVPVAKKEMQNIKYKALQIGIRLPKERLHKKIEKRILARFKDGMIKEVEKLHRQGLSWKKIRSFGLAYFWIPLYLQKKLSKPELFGKVFQAEKNYAKRQATWFKRDKRIKWLKSFREIEKVIKTFLR